MAKARSWTLSDAETRKPGERTGLDTPVVLAVNDGHWVGGAGTAGGAVKCVEIGRNARGESGRLDPT